MTFTFIQMKKYGDKWIKLLPWIQYFSKTDTSDIYP